tara:strand:+ start:66 stop:749 length:684 start_codon:yes stop_codon:yes gene_type:complete
MNSSNNSSFRKSEFFNKPPNHRFPRFENDNDYQFSNYKSSSSAFHKKQHMYSAGILPYQVGENKKIYFLVGKDHENNWSDFGGKCEFKDNNNVKETAAREFFEESLNSVIDINTAREMLRNDKNYTLIKSKTLSGSPYYMFVMRVPMLPDTCRDRFHKTLNYLRYINADSSTMEKTDIKWVSLDTITHCLDSPENEVKMGWPLRKIFKKTLVNNRKALDDFRNKNSL